MVCAISERVRDAGQKKASVLSIFEKHEQKLVLEFLSPTLIFLLVFDYLVPTPAFMIPEHMCTCMHEHLTSKILEAHM